MFECSRGIYRSFVHTAILQFCCLVSVASARLIVNATFYDLSLSLKYEFCFTSTHGGGLKLPFLFLTIEV